MARTNYIAKSVLAKKRRLTVHYRLERKNPLLHGPCGCGKSEGTFTVAITVDKVIEGAKTLSPHDLVARSAAGKVQNALKNGTRLCEVHLAELMEVVSRPDHLDQVFAS